MRVEEEHAGGREAAEAMAAVKRKNREKDEVIAKLFLHKNMLEARLAALDATPAQVGPSASHANLTMWLPGRQKFALERCTSPTLSRCTCSPRYGLHSCQRDRAGVVKRRRELVVR